MKGLVKWFLVPALVLTGLMLFDTPNAEAGRWAVRAYSYPAYADTYAAPYYGPYYYGPYWRPPVVVYRGPAWVAPPVYAPPVYRPYRALYWGW
jgi:hypothetical protein